MKYADGPAFNRISGTYRGWGRSGRTVTVTEDGQAATVYADEDLTTALSPVVTGADGSFQFFVLQGTYTVAVAGGNSETWAAPLAPVDEASLAGGASALTDLEGVDMTGAAEGDVLTVDADGIVVPSPNATTGSISPAPADHWIGAPAAVLATASFAIGDARIDYMDLPACTIDKLGCDVVTAGAAGAVVRLLAWADNGSGAPGTLLADGGTVSAESTGAKSVDVNFAHAGGRLWVCAVTQGAASTLRYVSARGGSQPVISPTTQPQAQLSRGFAATIAGAGASNPAGAWGFNAPPRVSVHIAPLV